MNKIYFIEKINKGFTLAEILITLSIIGIIASMIIPSLVQDIQDAQFKTAWKKIYSDLSQATVLIANKNAGSLSKLCSSHDCIRDQYIPYLNYIKLCNNNESFGNCFSNYKQLNGQPHSYGNHSGIILNNGALVYFAITSVTCTTNSVRCGWIHVDVNGFKGPNIIGKDVFGSYLYSNNLKPYGWQNDGWWATKSGTCNLADTGWGCSAEYLYK